MTVILISVIILILMIPFIGGSDFHFHKRKSDKIRVACVGDSITNGCMIPGCFYRSYPSRLQKILGNKYQVENYGLNDRTLQADGNKPYCKEKEYRKSLAFDPNIVIILLGTNDTKKINWKSKEHFMMEYRNLIGHYIQLESNPRIILLIPPWAKDKDKKRIHDTDYLLTDYLPMISDAIRIIGQEYGFTVVDLYSPFENRTDLLSFDALHPNGKGAIVIAEKVAEAVRK